MIHLSHKIALDPTATQRSYFSQAAGCARFTYNWALAEWKRQYEAGGKPNAMALKKQFNAVKYQQFSWMENIHRDAHAHPFTNVRAAFTRFFKDKKGYPKFKKKGKSHDSFYAANDKVKCDGSRVRLPVVGWVRTRETLRFTGKIMSAMVSRTANKWFISLAIEMPDDVAKRTRTGDGVVGVDVGIKHAAVLSTGEKIEAPKPLARAMRRLKIRSRSLSRKVKWSKNHRKQAHRLAKMQARIANIRHDFWHKLTTNLCKNHARIGVEDLNVKGMMANRRLSRALMDVGIGMMVPMLTYKAPLYGTMLVKADRWYPSSKTCSVCGTIKPKLTLGEREWTCECGAYHDRDINAARNLATLALRAACPEVTPVRHDWACRDDQCRNRSKSQTANLAVAV